MKLDDIRNSWRRLDNTAKIFSLAEDNDVNVFRYSVVLTQEIDADLLKLALDKALDCYPSFKVKICSGIFWNYLEFNSKEPIVFIEDEIPCQIIDYKKNNDYLFKVTYYKNKINLDVYHVLSDGLGAVSFFKSIIYNYLDLKKGILNCKLEQFVVLDACDQYLKNYDKKIKGSFKLKSAFQIHKKRYKNVNNTYHYIINLNEIKKITKKYSVIITEYLTSIYIYSLYLSFF